MNSMQNIMERIKATSGIDIPFQEMSWLDFAKLKCDSFNESTGNLNETDGYNCEKCKNRGTFAEMRFVNNDWYEVHPECECMKIRRTILRLTKSGLKNIMKDYTFSKYEASEAWQEHIKNKAIEYTKNPNGSWFFIGGQSGCGKTHICTAIAGQLLKNGKSVRYMLWRDDVNKIKGSITDSEKYLELMQTFKETEVLYIDDLFKNGKGADGKVQLPTASDVQTAFEILNYRANNKNLITIISSERRIYDLIEIDEAVGGRISEMSFEKGFGFNVSPDRTKNYRIRNLTDL